MTRIFGQYVLADMVVLWAFETLACFLLFLAALDHATLVNAAGQLGAADSALLLALVLGVLCIVLGLYKPALILATRMLLLAAAVAGLGTVPIVWAAMATGIIDATTLGGGGTTWLGEIMAAWLLLVLGTRLIYAAGVRSGLLVREVLVLGDGPAARNTIRAITGMQPRLFRATLAASANEAPRREPAGALRIIVANEGDVIGEVPAAWSGRVARLTDVATFWERHLGRIDLDGIDATRPWDLTVHPARPETRMSRLARRSVDVTLAASLLLFTLPIVIVTAVAIKLDSPGPLIYRQERIGLGGRSFTILKFRSMRTDAERDGVAVFARLRDARTTAVGRFIRKVRIDELPQLINILRGEMSIVGPRPERPDFVRRYTASIPFYDQRHQVKPGLTGWAQVHCPYSASDAETREKLSYDLYYVRNRSLLLDLSVLIATVRVILFQVGAR